MTNRAKIYDVAFQIGGKMDQSFSGSMLNAQKNIAALNRQVSMLESNQSGVKKFRTLKKGVLETEVALKKAQAETKSFATELSKFDPAAVDKSKNRLRNLHLEMARLTKGIKNAKKPSANLKKQLEDVRAKAAELKKEINKDEKELKRLGKGFDSARKKSRKLKDRLLDKRTEIAKLSRSMRKAGISTRNLAADNAALETRLNRTRAAQQKLNALLLKKKAFNTSRDEHQSRMVEAAGTGAAIAAPVVLPVKLAIDYESAMADVRKTVNFDTPKGFETFSKNLAAMPRLNKLPLFQKELAAIAASGGQLGIAAQNIPVFIDTTSKMAIAFDMMTDRAGDASAKLSNVYDLPISSITGLGDAVNHLSDNTAAKAHEMVDVMLRIGGTAKNIGLTAVQSAALGNAMLALGKRPEVAGTSIDFLLTTLATVDKQGGKFNDALDLMGVSADDLKDKLETDAQGAVLEFLESIEKVEKSDRQGVLVDLFGKDHAKHVGVLVGSLDKYRDAISLTADESQYLGSMQKEFENRSKTLKNELKLLTVISNEAAINFGTSLFPAISKVVGVLTAVASKAAVFTAQYPVVMTWIGYIGLGTAGLFGLVAAVSAVGFVSAVVLGGLTKWSIVLGFIQKQCLLTRIQLAALWVTQKAGAVSTGIMTAATWAWNAAMMANPIGLIIGGVAALGLLGVTIYKNWDTVSSVFKGIWFWIKKIFSFGFKYSPLGLLIQGVGKLKGIFGKSKNSVTLEEQQKISTTLNAVSHPESPDMRPEFAREVVTQSVSKPSRKKFVFKFKNTIHVPPGADKQQIRRVVQENQDQCTQKIREAMEDFMNNERRLAYG